MTRWRGADGPDEWTWTDPLGDLRSCASSITATLGEVLHRDILLPANEGIQSAVLPPVLTGTIQDGNAQFAVSIQSADGTAIDPSRPTWIIIHGWNSSPAAFDDLVDAIQSQRPTDQILVLDWHTAADTGTFDPFSAERRIPLVATWAAAALTDASFSGENLNEIGHSFGCYIAGEIAELISGGVNTLVALDPAIDVSGNYNPEGAGGVQFAQCSQYSWAFHDSDPANLANLDGLGSPNTPITADEAFDVANSNHTQIPDLFTYLLNHPEDPIGQYFTLDRLLDHQEGPWEANQYNASAGPSPGSGYEAVIVAANGGIVPQSIAFVAADDPVASNDFNGDGISDILWRNDAGVIATWNMSGGTLLNGNSFGTVPSNWTVLGTDDFNGDGRSDMLWRDTASGAVTTWDINNGTVIGTHSLGVVPANWHAIATGDFDGDHNADIFWRNDNGLAVLWDLNNSTLAGSTNLGVVPGNFHVEGTDDFNGDGRTDILWRNDSNGAVAIWDMNGGTVQGVHSLGVVPNNWHVVGTGDFNGDRNADILWQNDAGVVALWDLNNGSLLAGKPVAVLPSNWHVENTGDYNGDRMTDILLRNDAGSTAIWAMNDNNIISGHALGEVPTNWHILA